MKYYAIKRPDGSWIMESCHYRTSDAWFHAWSQEPAEDKEPDCPRQMREKMEPLGYRCVEVSGFTEVEK